MLSRARPSWGASKQPPTPCQIDLSPPAAAPAPLLAGPMCSGAPRPSAAHAARGPQRRSPAGPCVGVRPRARFPEHGSGRGAGTGSTDLLPLPRNHADPLAGAEVRQDPGGRGLRLRSEQPGPRLAPAAAAATSRSTKAGGLEEFPLGRRSELRDPRGCQAPAPDLVAARGGGRLAEGHQDRLCFGS